MKRLLTLTIVIATFMLVFIGQASDIRYKVNVRVKCDDGIIKDLAESYIKRELRNFSDVDVIRINETKPLFTLHFHVNDVTEVPSIF